MKNLRDVIVVGLILCADVYAVLLAGRYFGYNEMTMNVWAAAGVVALFLTQRYYAWWRH